MRIETMKPHEAKNLSELIGAIQQERGWKSTRETAEGIGISHSLVAQFERGGTTEDRRVLLALAKAARIRPIRVLEISGFLDRDSTLPPDIEAILDLLLQLNKSNPQLAAATKRMLYAQLSEALDLPADFFDEEQN